MIHLEDIAHFLQRGEEVQIIDNTTHQDITPKVLAQTFLKIATQNKNKDFIVFLFASLIRELQSNLPNFLSRLMQAGIGTELLTAEKLIKIIQDFIDIGEFNIMEQSKYFKNLLSKNTLNKNQIEEWILKNLKENNASIEIFNEIFPKETEKEKEFIYKKK